MLLTLSDRLRPGHRRQQGQASVFILIFLGVMLLALISLYKSGKITSEKMQLQNAADSAAYSVSLIEARDLNFMSYLNRAMVANEVAIGQMVSLMSWATYLASIPQFIRQYDALFLSGPTLGISSSIINPIAGVWDAVANVVTSVMRVITRVATMILHGINMVYSFVQTGFHATTIIFSVSTLDEMIRMNSPPRYENGTKVADGAYLSEFGIISLISHLISYGSVPGGQAVPLLRDIIFTRTHFPTQTRDSEGFERFAAITGESRDPFARSRGMSINWLKAIGDDPDGGLVTGWELPLIGIPPMKNSINLIPGVVEFSYDFAFSIDLARKGGAELRHVHPPAGEVSARGNRYNWSAADIIGLQMILRFGAELDILDGLAEAHVLFDIDPFTCEAGASAFGGIISFSISDLEDLLGFKICPDDMGITPGVPFGVGGAQAGQQTFTMAHRGLVTTPAGTLVSDSYGGAPKNIVSWTGIPFQPGVPTQMSANNINQNYRGLPMYTDTVDQKYNFGFLAPYFMVGLVKDLDDIRKTGPDYSGDHLDVLRVQYGTARNRIAALAKSEVYFKRPTDPRASYFHRQDGYTEVGNAFNPFWHARLVDTSWADRVISVLVQQHQDFTGFSETLFAPPTSWQDILDMFL